MNRRVLQVYPIVDLTQHRAIDVSLIESRIQAALRGGATVVQLREKADRFDAVARVVAAARPWLKAAGVPLIINDRLDLALELEADGVHLGQHDRPVAEARHLATAHGRGDFWIGISVTTPEQAREAIRQGATYVSASPVFGTATKPDLDPPIGTDGIRQLREAIAQVPLVAIGGIRPHNVADVVHAGADGVAFISPLERDPEAGVRQMRLAVLACQGQGPSQGAAP